MLALFTRGAKLWPLVLVILIGLGSSLLAAMIVQQREQHRIEQNFDQMAEDYVGIIRRGVAYDLTAIQTVAGLFNAQENVSRAAVVGYPHDIKGQGIYVYVTLVHGEEPSDELKKELVQWVRKEIGPIASPDVIQWAPGLPKTRSGKIMRRILRKIASNEHDQLGDTSTLADPGVVDDLISGRANK